MQEIGYGVQIGLPRAMLEMAATLDRHQVLVAERTASLREMLSRSREAVARSRSLLETSRDIRWR